MFNGAQLNLELFEVRAQVYFLFGYLMAMNGATEPREQVRRMMWMTAILVVVKAVFACIRYYVEQGGATTPETGIGAHEESFFFDVYIILWMVLCLSKVEPKLRLFMTIISASSDLDGPPATSGVRRPQLFIFAIPIVFALAAAGFKERRRMIATTVAILSVCTAIYLPIFWNQDGACATARAVKSQFTPDNRDQLSNLYRDQEDANLYFTMMQNPILGYGYGRPFIIINAMVDLTNIDPLIHFIPHDQILWVWMRIGTVGFVVFWIMFAIIVICCTQAAKEPGYYPDIRATGVFTATLVVMLLIFGVLDMQLSNIRDMLFVSIWVGNLAYMRSFYIPVKPEEDLPQMTGWTSFRPRPRVQVTSFGDQESHQ